MKIVITGGSGFLGSHIADELTRRGHEVTIFDKKKSIWINSNQKMYVGNILNHRVIEKAIKNAKIVFHFAALADLDEAYFKPLETVKNNILGTVNILELSRKHNIKRVIYASSIYTTSIQGSFYRCSKKASEDYIEEYYKRYGLNFTVIRYGSLYGKRSNRTNGVFRILEDALKNKKFQYIGSRNSVRRYIHVSDAAKATAEVLSDKYKNKYVNIVGAKSYKVTQLFKIVAKSVKISSKVKYLNSGFAGHYVKSPKLFKLRTGTNYRFNKYIKFDYGIKGLINYIKSFTNAKTAKKTS